MNRFLDLADFPREQIKDLLGLAARLQQHPQPQALAGKVLGLLFLNPSLRTLASFQSAMMRLGGTAVVITPGQGTWQMETRSGAIMNGAAAEHVREAVPVLASYCDAMGIRMFAEGRNLAADLAETGFRMMADLCDKPLVNMESAMSHPCQALADWHTLDELRVPERGKFVLVLGQSSARAAARRALLDRAHGGDARHGSRRAATRRLRAAGTDHGEGAPGGEGVGRRRCARRPIAPKRSTART